ncbi:hypothetical protein RJ640_018327 [Escallonia rubra]|uniref:Cytochrome P450 n=1 Tax=Escallonia rubra TaxID=112253 RepID=A0AA88ULF8_9ASTE|nr:hypothetical protein RJ640_018327 [Escallonia rubra]
MSEQEPSSHQRYTVTARKSSLGDMELFQFPLPIIILFILFLIFLFELLKVFKKDDTSQKLPPGPRKLPLIGNLFSLVGSLPHRALRDLAKKYGGLMHLQLGEIPAVVVSSSRVAKEVLKVHDHAFSNRPELLAVKILMYNCIDLAFSPYGEYWRQMRKICTLELLSAKKVKSFSSIREGEVWHLIESVRLTSGSVINLSEKIYALSNAVTRKAVFGDRCKDQDALIQAIHDAISTTGGFDVSDLFPSFKLLHFFCGMRSKVEKVHQKVDQIFDTIIHEREQSALRNKKNDNDNTGMEDLLDDMFSGGTDTSSTIIEWAISEMIRHPTVMEKAQAELRQALGKKKIIYEADIRGLSYLKLVIKETLRLHPASPFLPRECREQCEIDGYIIPKKTRVIVNVWAIGTDPEYWHNAEQFQPERFENNSIEFTGSNLEYIPFGAGRRMCPGLGFGLANVELPLAQLLYHFNWNLPVGSQPEELDMSETFGASVGRKYDLRLIATPHSSFGHLTGVGKSSSTRDMGLAAYRR